MPEALDLDPPPASPERASRAHDPLLIAAQVMLYILLAGIALAAVALVVGLVTQLANEGFPWRRALTDPAWSPVSDALFALGALWLVADSALAVLAMIASVGRGAAFEAANVARLERIAGNTIGLAVLGLVAKFAGSGIRGDVNGFEMHVDLTTSIGFALLLFILARVFRQGAAMRADLEGTI